MLKFQNVFSVLCKCIALLIVTALPVGCNEQSQTQPELKTVRGWVSAGSAISASSLEIDTLDGKQIYRKMDYHTDDLGSFMISVDRLPTDFRITTRNGIFQGEPFLADLSADYRNFDPENDTVYVNIVTTMVSVYLDKHPKKTLDEARVAVKKFLEIPDWVSIGNGLWASGEFFNHGKFIEASNNGGIIQYINLLIAEMDGGDVTHPFPGAARNGMTQSAATFVAGGLANGALSYVGGHLMGWGLSQLGLGFPDKTEKALNEIKQQLAEMQSQMREMQNQLVQICKQMNALSDQMRGVESRLSAEMKQYNWDSYVHVIVDLLPNIISIREDLTNFVVNPPTNKAAMNQQRADIMRRIETQILPHENTINSLLYPLAGSTSGLKLWSQIIASHHRFLNSGDSNDVQSQFEYFDTAQLWVTELIVEYYHAKATSYDTSTEDGQALFDLQVGYADKSVKKYLQNRENQQTFLLPSVPDGVIYDKSQDFLILYKDGNKITNVISSWETAEWVRNDLNIDRTTNKWQILWSHMFESIFPKTDIYSLKTAISQGWPSDFYVDKTAFSTSTQGGDSNYFSLVSLSGNPTQYILKTDTGQHPFIFYRYDGLYRQPTKFFW